MTMGKRLQRFGEVRIVDEMNGFGLDFVEKTESRFWSTTPDVGRRIFSLTFENFMFWLSRKEHRSSLCKI